MSNSFRGEDTVEMIQQIYPLSEQQANIYRLEQRYPRTSIGVISGTLKITGKIDYDLLEQAVNFVIEEDDNLRTRIVLRDGVPMQYIEKYSPRPVDFLDFTITGQEGLFLWDRCETRTPFELFESDLYYFAIVKISENRGGLFIKTHHIITDGWSTILLSNRITEAYQRLVKKRVLSLGSQPKYLKYLQAAAQYERSPRWQSDEAFWTEKMTGLPEKSAIKDYGVGGISIAGDRKTFVMPEKIAQMVRGYCAEHNVTTFSVMLSALCIYVHRIAGLNRMVFGVPILNRSTYEEKNTIGMFVSTIPMVVDIDENMTFSQFNSYLLGEWLHILRHQRFPFSRILQLARSKNGPIERLFDITLNYQCSHFSQDEEGTSISHEGRWHYSGCQAEPICIHINERENDGKLIIDYDYLVQLFTRKEIEYIHTHVMHLLTDAMEGKQERPIHALQLLEQEEYDRIVTEFNNTAAPVTEGETVHGRVASLAALHGPDTAVCDRSTRLTFAMLEKQAAAVAAVVGSGVGVAAVMLERGAGLLPVMLGVMQAGAALLLIDRSMPPARMRYILEDAKAEVLLTTHSVWKEQEARGLSFGGRVLFTDRETIEQMQPSAGAGALSMTGREPAYIIYTSGTTGEPKGVVVSHRALLNFADGMTEYCGGKASLSMTTVCFDVFMMETMAALLNGHTVVMALEEEQNNPEALAGLIEAYDVGMLCSTPSRLRAYLECGAFSAAAARLNSIVCGGERFPADLLYMLKERTSADVYNQYGPSEATIGVTIKRLQTNDFLLIGRPMRNVRAYILDSHRHPVPIGTPGELYVGGECLAEGYLDRPELTEERFVENPMRQGERLYRTGDLARWYPRGEIEFLGRVDTQVKIRGFRVELGEIETRVKEYPPVTNAVIRVKNDHQGVAYLCLYFVAEEKVEVSHLKDFLAAHLPYYMIPAFMDQIDVVPLTSNGKIDYDRLPEPSAVQNDQEYIAPSGLMEIELAALWRRQLGMTGIGATTDYFAVGGNSLSALELLVEIHNTFDVSLSFTDVYNHPTIRGMAGLIAGARRSFRTPISPAPKEEYYPLTPSQKRIFALEAMRPGSMAYNMPGLYRIRGRLDVGKLEKAIRTVIDRHEILRTFFTIEQAQVVQKVLPQVDFRLEQLSAGDPEKAFAAFVRPFDLGKAPLLRGGVMRSGEEEYFLMLDQHHIVSDGRSGELFMEELNQIYSGKTPPPPRIQYKDYAAWLKKNDNASWMESQRDYWLQQFAESAPLLDLPLDHPRPAQPDGKSGRICFAMPRECFAQINRYCGEKGVTSYMYFLTVFSLALARFTGQEEVVVGTPFSGRRQPEIENVMGVFINTLPLRLSVGLDQEFDSLAAKTRACVLGALDNQDYPFDRLVDELKIPRDISRNPLFDVMFVIQPFDASLFSLDGVEMELAHQMQGGNKLDIFLEGSERDGGFSFTLEYAASLFEEKTMRSFIDCFVTLAGAAVQQPNKEAGRLPYRSWQAVEELNRVLERPEKPVDGRCLDELIAAQAALHPEKPAVRFHGAMLTYGELDAAAENLAHKIMAAGVKPGSPVAVVSLRGMEMMTALLATLKAGCCYVPVDPAYPEGRKSYLMENSRAAAVLAGPEGEIPSGFTGAIVPIVVHTRQPGARAFSTGRNQSDAAYILYTSGSTGRPKGVVVTHKNVVNMVESMREDGLAEEDTILCSTTVCFDVFVIEGLVSLALGVTVALCDEEEQRLPWRMAELIEDAGATVMQMTPSRMQVFLENEEFRRAVAGLHRILLAGEPLETTLLLRLRAMTGAQIWNMYGPTETTIYSTGANLTKAEYSHIGRPVRNTQVHVLDNRKQPVVWGARGELYIGGAGVSKGYIYRPELTAEHFLDNPFGEGKLYKSGDIVRLDQDGNLQFIGRADNQIKYRGLRIELGEIESCMVESGLVSDAAVTASYVAGGSMSLRGAVIPLSGYSGEKLRAYLKANLPEYMIPAVIVPMKRFPQTPSGKVDRQALAAMKAEDSGGEQSFHMELVTVMSGGLDGVEAGLQAVWEEVIGSYQRGRSFFEQGGDSMSAIVVLTKYYEHGWIMSVKDFYDNPTLEGQALLLSGGKNQTSAPKRRYPAKVPQPVAGGVPPLRHVLVTGGTGFLGAHILRELLQDEAVHVICLTRARQSRRQVLERYAYYFGGDEARRAADRINCLTANLCEPFMGLPEDIYLHLAAEVDTVFHCAANVRHYGELDVFLRDNVESTRQVIAFAERAGAYLAHCSTLSVCGTQLTGNTSAQTVFTEDDLYIGQNVDHNNYVYSKFLAEEAFCEAAARGLRGAIFRIGHLTGRWSDGTFQPNAETNALYLRLRAVMCLGAMPASMREYPMEFTPVDVCAAGIVSLVQGGTGHTVYHMACPLQMPLHTVMHGLGREPKWLPQEEFETAARRKIQEGAAGELGSLLSDIASPEADNIRPDSGRTAKDMAAVGVPWPVPNEQYLERLYRWMTESGFIQKPENPEA